jgi:hypothetical protein
MSTFCINKNINFKFKKPNNLTKKLKSLSAIPFQTAMYSEQDYHFQDVNFNNLGIYNYWKNHEMINQYKKIIDITEYNINLNSKDRNIQQDKNPLEFTIKLSDFDTLPNIYKNVKYLNFDHIVFPYFYQLYKYDTQDNNIISDMSKLFILNYDNYSKINTEIQTNNGNYQICNIKQDYNFIEINFTINKDKYICYSFINNNNTISLFYYKGLSIKNPDNFINYISINQVENKYILSTKNFDFYKEIYPKLKINSELYVATRKSFVVYKNSDLATFNKFTIKLFNSNFKQILIDNLDYNIDFTYICNCDLETINYSCKCYYLRHPFNSFFQIDLFIKIGSYTVDFNKEIYI